MRYFYKLYRRRRSNKRVETWKFEYILKKWKITIELLLIICKDIIIVLINNFALINLCLRKYIISTNVHVYSNNIVYIWLIIGIESKMCFIGSNINFTFDILQYFTFVFLHFRIFPLHVYINIRNLIAVKYEKN